MSLWYEEPRVEFVSDFLRPLTNSIAPPHRNSSQSGSAEHPPRHRPTADIAHFMVAFSNAFG
jgi:hypothetical protein